MQFVLKIGYSMKRVENSRWTPIFSQNLGFRGEIIFHVLMNIQSVWSQALFPAWNGIHYTRIPLYYQGLRHVVQSKQSFVHMNFFTYVTQNLD